MCPCEWLGMGDIAADVRGEVGVVILKLDCSCCWGAGKGERGPSGVLKLREEEKGDWRDCRNPWATGD